MTQRVDEAIAAIRTETAKLMADLRDAREALSSLLDEAEDVFVCMADATGIDRHNLPGPFVAARAALAKLDAQP